ncbi:aldose epimerase family protein [Lactobacillus sp. PV034]|uniref:aldose epimerase family protein n=1 Tax=Lactobacillus sp. PV034 TaxID=2594495 RepID=UPI0022401363|nr:aldose epimerase family protein [Lactobacillus sp. PV034]QNQ80228.1 galactose mutarotase [Lactobacillus sp. PV034]
MQVYENDFGKVNDKQVTRYTIENDHGVRISVLNYGGIWQEYSIPTAKGNFNLLLAGNSMADYLRAGYSIGQLIGPVANRTKNAEFQIDGKTFYLQKNEGKNNIHSGDQGWQNQFWDTEAKVFKDRGQIVLHRNFAPDDDGFPANTDIDIVYSLDNLDQVTIDLYGQSDAPTLFNPTSHTYWNLSDTDKTIEGQKLTINSNYHLAVDHEKLPTGKLLTNESIGYDFKAGACLKETLAAMNQTPEKGYDDFFVVKPSSTYAHDPIAILQDPKSGREMRMYSDRNALIMFSANGLPDDAPLNHQGNWSALALEAQNLPDATDFPEFGDITLRPLAPVHHRIRYEIKY